MFRDIIRNPTFLQLNTDLLKQSPPATAGARRRMTGHVSSARGPAGPRGARKLGAGQRMFVPGGKAKLAATLSFTQRESLFHAWAGIRSPAVLAKVRTPREIMTTVSAYTFGTDRDMSPARYRALQTSLSRYPRIGYHRPGPLGRTPALRPGSHMSAPMPLTMPTELSRPRSARLIAPLPRPPETLPLRSFLSPRWLPGGWTKGNPTAGASPSAIESPSLATLPPSGMVPAFAEAGDCPPL
jgi:hypothetical protein